jgi:hypothetical protein
MFSKLIRFGFINTKQISFIMKKIIALFVLMLGVSFTASAQKATKPATSKTATTKEANIEKAAIEDSKALNEFIPLTNQQMQDFKGLFAWKHQQLADGNLTDERKKLIADTVEAKINATLTSEQSTKLSQNQKLVKILTGKK